MGGEKSMHGFYQFKKTAVHYLQNIAKLMLIDFVIFSTYSQ